MLSIHEITIPGYEKVIEGIDPDRGLHCFIALHNSTLGPCIGGLRIKNYQTREEALEDVLRLAKGMTYKTAAIKCGFGGGKSVIIAAPHQKTPELLHAFAEILNSLKGSYITGEDLGSDINDITILHQHTPYVAAFDNLKSSGDPSRFTAWGVYKGMQAIAKELGGGDATSLKGKRIAIQGLGHVGSKLCDTLFWEGAELLISDTNRDLVEKHHHQYHAEIIDNKKIMAVDCDIFSPCALGGIINEKSISKLHCKAIAGAANNQLATPELAEELKRRNILYAPDYIINAGGLINVVAEYEERGYCAKNSLKSTNQIYDFLLEIFKTSKSLNKSTLEIANTIAENQLLNHARYKFSR